MLFLQKISSALNKGSERSVNVKKNIAGSIMIKGFSILISLWLVPLTLGYLSSEMYGIWLTVSSIIVWLNFFDVGFTLGLKNRLSEALANHDISRAKALVSTTYMVMIVIFVPLCLILELLVPYINWSTFLNVSQDYSAELAQVVKILVICLGLQMIFNVITAVLAAIQKVALSTLFPVLGNALACVVILILTKTTPPSLYNLALAISFLPIIVLAVSSIWLFVGQLKHIRPSIKSIDTALVKDIFTLGAKFFIIQIQMLVLYQSTNILMSNLGTPTDVTTYNIAYKYLGTAMMFFSIIMGPLWPAFTDAYTMKDYRWMQTTYLRMMKLAFVVMAGVIGMMLISPWIYRVWVGAKAEIPCIMTISVGIYVIIHIWDSLQVMLINGTGCVKLQTYVTIVGLLLHIPLSLFIGSYIGAIGVIFSMIVINIIYSTLFTIQLRKLITGKASRIWCQ